LINLFHQIAVPASHPRSLEGAIEETGASRLAVKAVQALMQDGAQRTDEEIASAVRKPGGGRWSPDTVRHARFALQIAGALRWTGAVKETVYARPSRSWVRS
jgi:hypothetical protein